MLYTRLTAVAVLFILGLSSTGRAADRIAASIVAPEAKQKTGQYVEISGRILTRGAPTVVVRAKEENALWWIQPPVTLNKGLFRGVIRVGSDETKDGTKFEIAVLMPRSLQAARVFVPGRSLKRIPSGIPMSQIVVVEYSSELYDASLVRSFGVSSPKPNATVSRRELIVVKRPPRGAAVVLVRAQQAGSLWWVQPIGEAGQDEVLVVPGRFGNAKSTYGEKFLVVVAYPRDARELSQFRPGTTFRQLPPTIARSRQLTVVLGEKKKYAKENNPRAAAGKTVKVSGRIKK